MSAEEASLPPRPGRARRRIVRYGALLAVLGLAAYFVQDWVVRRQTHVYVIDSRIASDIITIGAQDGGVITELPVGTGDVIRRGAVLVRIDHRELDLQIEEVLARMSRLPVDRARLEAEMTLTRRQVEAATEAARARIAVAEAERTSVEALMAQATRELERAEQLYRRKVVSSRAVDDARADFADLEGRMLRARAAVLAARAEQRQAEAERDRIEVLARQIELLEAERPALQARLDQLQTRRDDRNIASGIDGVVDQTFIEAGEYVRPGQRLLMIHDPDNVWVAANIKETELGRFRVGSRAIVRVDAFPGREITGRVTWIAPAASSVFALLPNPNPSGNFTKVTQRVPVRIDLEGAKEGLRPGMMVEVAIDAERD